MSQTGYFAFHYKALRLLGLGMFHSPVENNFDNYPTRKYALYAFLCVSVNVVGYLIAEILFAYQAWSEHREANVQFFSFTLVGVHFFAVVKIFILILNNVTIQKIVRVLEVESITFNGDRVTLERSKFITKIVTGFFLFFGELTMLLMVVYSLTADHERNKKLKLNPGNATLPRDTPFAAYVPWDKHADAPYAAACLYSVFGMFWMGSTLIVCDTMIASIMVHISGQFRMVQKVMENTGEKAIERLTQSLERRKGKPTSSMLPLNVKFTQFAEDAFSAKKRKLLVHFTEEEFNTAIICSIKDAIRYHKLIISITEDLQAAYRQAFLCQTLSSFYVIGLILVQTAQDASNIYSLRLVNNLGFLISILWQLFMQTYSANEITLEAFKVSESVYASRWYATGADGSRIRRLLTIILLKAQRPLHLNAGFFSPMSNALFVAIIRSAYQMFTLITTVMSGDK